MGSNDVQIKIDIDSKTGEARVEALGDAFRKTGKKSKTALETIGKEAKQLKAAMVPTIGLASGLGAAFGAWQLAGVANDFLSTSMAMEKYETTLGTVLKSTGRAKDMMSWITDFAASTPFEIPGLVEASTRLEAYGMDAKRYMRTLGDTAGAMGKPIMAAVEMIADASQGEFERLKEFGFRATDVAKAAGFATVQAMNSTRENLTKGTETLMAMLEKRYAGGMASLSKTLGGMWSNLKDSYTQFQVQVMNTGVFDYIKAGVTLTIEEITRLKTEGDLGAWALAMGENILTGFDVIIKGAALVGDAFHGWRIIWSGLNSAFAATMVGITGGFEKLFEMSLKVTEFFGSRDKFTGLETAYQEIKTANAAWNAVLEESSNKTDILLSKTSNYSKSSTLIDNIRAGMAKVKTVTEQTTAAVTNLGTANQTAAGQATIVWQTAADTIKSDMGDVAKEIQGYIDDETAAEKEAAKLAAEFEAAKGTATRLEMALSASVHSATLTRMEQAYGSHAEAMEAAATGMTGKMADAFGDNLFRRVTGDLDSFSKVWTATWHEMARVVIVDVSGKVAAGVSSMLTSASTSLVGGLASAAGAALGGIGSSLVSGAKSLFGFDQGAWMVPEDMVARVHKGEAIIPAEIWQTIQNSRMIGAQAKPFGTGLSAEVSAYNTAGAQQATWAELSRFAQNPFGYIAESARRYMGPGNFMPAAALPVSSKISDWGTNFAGVFGAGPLASYGGLISDAIFGTATNQPWDAYKGTWNNLMTYARMYEIGHDTRGEPSTGSYAGAGTRGVDPGDEHWHGGGGLITSPRILHGAGELGPEWIVPTYEPQRSNFLKDVGADPKTIARSIGAKTGQPVVVNLVVQLGPDDIYQGVHKIAAATADKVTRIKARRGNWEKPLSRGIN